MEETEIVNRVLLCGAPLGTPEYSHENRKEPFYRVTLETVRLSGAADRLNVILRRELLDAFRPSGAGLVEVDGQLRSFNNRSGAGSRLVLSVFARNVYPAPEPVWKNEVILKGTLCRPPVHRMTPMGREIADLLLAVDRPYGRSDYLPCIVWGRGARAAAALTAGQTVRLRGRFQSREYMKNTPEGPEKRVAYEVSVAELETGA